jgi:quinoprotein glucose dehydrogenase
MELIDRGKGVMPSFKQIPVHEKEALVSFLSGDISKHVTDIKGGDTNSLTVPYTTTGYNRFFDQLGYPAVKPPWGTLSAIDLNKGIFGILWKFRN